MQYPISYNNYFLFPHSAEYSLKCLYHAEYMHSIIIYYMLLVMFVLVVELMVPENVVVVVADGVAQRVRRLRRRWNR